MTDRILKMRNFFITDKKHREFRSKQKLNIAEKFAESRLTDIERSAKRLIAVLSAEKPVLFDDERIAFTRTVTEIPEMYTEAEYNNIVNSHWIHERGEVCNINVDYTMLLNCGFDAKISELKASQKAVADTDDEYSYKYIGLQIEILNQIQNLADRYRMLALQKGNNIVAEVLSRVPAKAPSSFLEALQMFRIIHFAMWCGGNYHNTIGRFDQYMYPYFKADIEKGVLDKHSAVELLEEFFITFNRDSDLYPGMQQGDNGQSMVLGGINPDGSDSYNLLSELCLEASLDLSLIDPKINIRVNKNTPVDRFVLGTRLTKQGLGFPQYSNDDVVIPGLIEWE